MSYNSYTRENCVLGEGSYATVYKGHLNNALKTPCAIKVVNYSTFTDEQKRLLENEVRILTRLSRKFPDSTKNPFIHFHNATITGDNELSIVTELASGEELDIYCTRFVSGCPERIAKLVFYRILSATKILHEEGMCHLDLKLENIMYDRTKNQIKILDFGFSTNSKNSHGTKYHKIFRGSIHYVAPEIVNNIPYDGCKADVWALGVTLYIMLIGYFPFDTTLDDNEVIFAKIRENTPTYPRFLSTGALKLLRSMLNSVPSKRPSISDVMQHQWFQ
mmetsp:Transcript_20010/g.25308  ORF Transcript_20010/g.25308 Transcript_20010/m.25308 type:complete len:276 (-) Transcript_20010:57-884(-)